MTADLSSVRQKKLSFSVGHRDLLSDTQIMSDDAAQGVPFPSADAGSIDEMVRAYLCRAEGPPSAERAEMEPVGARRLRSGRIEPDAQHCV